MIPNDFAALESYPLLAVGPIETNAGFDEKLRLHPEQTQKRAKENVVFWLVVGGLLAVIAIWLIQLMRRVNPSPPRDGDGD